MVFPTSSKDSTIIEQTTEELPSNFGNNSMTEFHTSTPQKRKGGSLSKLNQFAKVSKLNPELEFVWYDNLNEIVDRYKLLLAAQEAGNTNVINEILAIEEELNEMGINKKKS